MLFHERAMEALVPNPSSSVATSQASDHSLSSAGTRKSVHSDGPRISAGKMRANGTVVLATPTQMKHVVTSSSQNTQAVAVPQTGGSVTILQLANQPMHVQSVIQPNQQSVIQAPGGSTLQSLQLPKNMILLNKLTQGPIIQSTDGDPVQLITTTKDEDGNLTLLRTDDAKKRQILVAARKPYRKVANELSTDVTSENILKDDSSNLAETSQETSASSGTITIGGTQYSTSTLLKGLYTDSSCLQNAFQLATASQESNVEGLQTVTMTNANSGATETIMQYTQNEDGQFLIPVTVSAADLQAYQLRAGASTPTDLSQNVISNISIQSPLAPEEASQKRERRLLKNREAAKECRRKKKEYIKCLENRVAVLENQNVALIEELKTLKELYCQKNE